MSDQPPFDAQASTMTIPAPLLASREQQMPEVIAKRYRITGLIGRGGMSDVYQADDLLLERPVAIKLLHRRLASDSAGLERFRREGKTLAAVCSPHVVGIYDLGIENDVAYLVMQYVVGHTLEQEVAQHGPLSPVRAGSILSQVLDGLVALHARGLVHRDIKPSNVLVDANDRVVLLDLGIAFDSRRSRLTNPGHVAGTPGYIAPERATLRSVDMRSDLYQVGLLIVFLMTGVDPARTPTLADDVIDQLSSTYASIARRALSAAPQRFPSASEMARAVAVAREVCKTTRIDGHALGALVAGMAEEPDTEPDSIERAEAVGDSIETAAMLAAELAAAIPSREGGYDTLLDSTKTRETPVPRFATGSSPPATRRVSRLSYPRADLPPGLDAAPTSSGDPEEPKEDPSEHAPTIELDTRLLRAMLTAGIPPVRGSNARMSSAPAPRLTPMSLTPVRATPSPEETVTMHPHHPRVRRTRSRIAALPGIDLDSSARAPSSPPLPASSSARVPTTTDLVIAQLPNLFRERAWIYVSAVTIVITFIALVIMSRAGGPQSANEHAESAPIIMPEMITPTGGTVVPSEIANGVMHESTSPSLAPLPDFMSLESPIVTTDSQRSSLCEEGECNDHLP